MDRKDDAEKPSGQEDEIPRHTLFSAIPKRTLTRVLVLLAVLGAILYLRERTSSIAGCMSTAFQVPPAAAPQPSVRATKARIELRTDASRPSR